LSNNSLNEFVGEAMVRELTFSVSGKPATVDGQIATAFHPALVSWMSWVGPGKISSDHSASCHCPLAELVHALVWALANGDAATPQRTAMVISNPIKPPRAQEVFTNEKRRLG
jgi:hypothetical protein